MIPGAEGGEGWDRYWHRTREAAAHRGGGPQDEVLARFWESFFDDALVRPGAARFVDVGCGNGAVARFALGAAVRVGRSPHLLVGIDSSLPALHDLRRRFPAMPAIAADGKRIPFPDACFDVVSSQFGLEYAGPDAFSEAARLVATGGTLAAVIHLKDGALYRECAVNLEAVTAVNQCGLLPATRDVFTTSQALARGKGSRVAFRRASEELAGAVRKVDEVLRIRGAAVAGGQLQRLRGDIAHMHARMEAHDPAEVASWTDAMAREMEAYAHRLNSMLGAAVDDRGMEAIVGRAVSRGLSVRLRERLLMGSGTPEPAAWVLVCDRT
jgi:SAM-dependent methyltransferase